MLELGVGRGSSPWAPMGARQPLPPELQFPFSACGGCPRVLAEAIRRKVELEWATEDDEYLTKVERNLEKALQEHRPDVVVYNAGTDVLEGDRLGGLSISPQVRPDPGAAKGPGTQQSSEGSSAGAPPGARRGRAGTAAVWSGVRPAAGLPNTGRTQACLSQPPPPPTGHREAG